MKGHYNKAPFLSVFNIQVITCKVFLFFLPGFSMESIPESWLLLSDESFVLKDSRLSFCCDDSSLNAILQDSRLGWFDFLGPEI